MRKPTLRLSALLLPASDGAPVAVNLGTPLNTVAGEFQPTLSLDARTLIFTSNRAGSLGNTDIWITRRQLNP